MKKGILKNIFGDLFTSTAGTALGVPTIAEGIELLPTDRAAGIIKIIIGAGTLVLGLLTSAKGKNADGI
jgi:hypothetical protein